MPERNELVRRPLRGLYAVIAAGVAVLALAAVAALTFGGLPGTANSPSASVHDERVVGRTASD